MKFLRSGKKSGGLSPNGRPGNVKNARGVGVRRWIAPETGLFERLKGCQAREMAVFLGFIGYSRAIHPKFFAKVVDAPVFF